MKPVVLLIVLLLAFLGGDDVLSLLGYPHNNFDSSFVFRLHPLTYLAGLLVLYYLKTGKLKFSDFFSKMKNETIFLLVCFAIIGYLGLMGTLNAFSFLLDALCLPAILSILLKVTDNKTLSKFRGLIYFCFFLNVVISVIEKIRGTSLISSDDYGFTDYYRSTALYGHPLNNALIMAVLTVVLFFGSKSTPLKLTVLIFGLLSIFCFGARGALIGVFLGVITNVLINFFYWKQKKIDKHKAKSELIYLGVLVAVPFVVITFTNLADRIVATSFMDSSAEARVNSFDVLYGLNFSDLLWGFGTKEIDYFRQASGVSSIENFWIDWLLKFGLIATIVLVFFLFRFLYRMTAFIKKDIKLMLLFVLFFVASTNNSLSGNTLTLSIFVLACYIVFDYKEESMKKVSKYNILDLAT